MTSNLLPVYNANGDVTLENTNPYWYGSGVARIVWPLIGVGDPARTVVVVLITKLDASGTDDANAIITMAGYVAMFQPWIDLELAARKLFDANGVTLLHAKEFYDTKGEFAGWSRDRKTDFIRELQKLMTGRVDLGITFSAVKSEFLKAKTEHGVAHNESVFGFCFRAIADRLIHDAVMKEALARGENLSFVLECGDENSEDAKRIFNQMAALSPWHEKVFYSFGYAKKRSAIGLQIADFLAVTSRKYVGKYSDKEGYAEESAILSILREGIYLIDDVAISFAPAGPRQRE